jgi:hypothetical protein
MNRAFKYNEPFRALQAGDFEEFKRMHQAGLTKLDDEFIWCWGSHLHGFLSDGSHLDFLKYIVENIIENDEENFFWDKTVTYWAAAYGRLDCLQYVKEKGFEWDEDTMGGALRHGSLECLQFAHENGCQLSPSISSHAAMTAGSLECLIYVLNNGSVWDQETTFWAAAKGHLNILKFAHDNGYYWHPDTIGATAENAGGHINCFEYCFAISTDKENFWKPNFNRIIPKIDFAKALWRPLFSVDLSKNQELQKAVNEAKEKIESLKNKAKTLLENKVLNDIIEYSLFPFF